MLGAEVSSSYFERRLPDVVITTRTGKWLLPSAHAGDSKALMGFNNISEHEARQDWIFIEIICS